MENGWDSSKGRRWLKHIKEFEAMLEPVNRPLIDSIIPEKCLRIAEIGSGSGASTFEVCKHAQEGSAVDGYDISPDLTKYANSRRYFHQNKVTPNFHQADAEIFKPDNLYDMIFSRFGIMFFENEEAAFSNLANWLTPGGAFCFFVWGNSENNPWIHKVKETISSYIEFPKPDADAPGPFRYSDSQKLVKILSNSGFNDIKTREWKGELAVGGGMSAPEASEFVLKAFSAAVEVLEKASNETKSKIFDHLCNSYSTHESQGVVRMPSQAYLLTGKI